MTQSTHGPFEQSLFLGATVLSWQENIGWNEQVSVLTVNLVEDKHPDNLQTFTVPQVGQPVYFEFTTPKGTTTPSNRNVHKFYGLLQSWEKQRGEDGNPIYSVNVIDPREVLSGVQLILDGYIGSSFIPNVLNVYGFLEHQGFQNSYRYGASEKNNLGISWLKIQQAIGQMTAPVSLASPYGTRPIFRGASYFIDLSTMPLMPVDYRLGTNNIDLLSCISQICQDAGYDYTISLLFSPQLGNVIKVRTVSRRLVPVLGGIDNFVNNLPEGTWIRNSVGRELRNEDVNSVLVGGQLTGLWRVPTGNIDNCGNFVEDDKGRNIWPYWGLDDNGNILEGIGFGDNHYVDLPIPETRILTFNNDFYRLSVGEMRAALGGQDQWEAYTQDIALKFNFDLLGNTNIALENLQDLLTKDNFQPNDILEGGRNLQDEDTKKDLDELYEQIRRFAGEFYGKKFLVRLPVCDPRCGSGCAEFNTHVTIDPVTDYRLTSWVPVEGAFLPPNDSALGLSVFGVDFMRIEDGRLQSFVVFNNAGTIDYEKLDPTEYIIENGLLYLKVQLEPEVVFVDRLNGLNPYAVVTLPNGISSKDIDIQLQSLLLLIVQWINLQEDIDDDEKNQLLDRATTLFTTAGADAIAVEGEFQFLKPDIAAIALESTILTYGPWYSYSGQSGRVRYEQNYDLVPWNFGTIENMNEAANRIVRESTTLMQESETGYVEFAGIPTFNLADQIVVGGPTIDNISVSLGQDGFTTTYRFRTFTPSFGLFAKYNADRVRTLGKKAERDQRYIRDIYRRLARKEARKKNV